MNPERRFNRIKLELRAADAKPTVITGYAAKYNSPSNPLPSKRGMFVEVIEPGFFDNAMGSDVRALFNHDENLILARSNAGQGTLRIFSDDVGLGYEFTPPDTQAGRDLAESIKRGDIDSSSFSFTVREGGDKWERRDGQLFRILTAGGCAELYDVSPVTYPAYPDATSGIRSLDIFCEAEAATAAASKLPPFIQSGARAARFGIR